MSRSDDRAKPKRYADMNEQERDAYHDRVERGSEEIYDKIEAVKAEARVITAALGRRMRRDRG